MNDTKQITFEGLTYAVPTWVEWVARDEGGAIYGYDYEPYPLTDEWDCPLRAEVCRIDTPEDTWKDSLVKV